MMITFLKIVGLSLCLNGPSFQTIAASAALQEANHTIDSLYRNTPRSTTLSERINAFSHAFLGKPYLLGALGEGEQALYDQMPLYRTDAFDCETYVDTVLALALSHDLHSFQKIIRKIRYNQGQVSFITRNHFTCLDWNQHNQQQGFLRDITPRFVDHDQRPVAKIATALIDKPAWYAHFSTEHIRLHQATPDLIKQRLASLKEAGAHLPRTVSSIPYLPLSALFDQNGHPNHHLFNQIPDAAIIEIIRPNWDLRDRIGTHLNVSHLGFAIKKQGGLYFREASTTSHVIDVSLIDYLRDARNSPTIKGINVQVVK